MGRIDNENTKILRQAMDVLVEVESTSEKPTDLSATNILSAYTTNARPTDAGLTVTLMDFANGGFINDGAAKPIQATALPSGQKYGYIASQPCNANGDLLAPVVVSFDSDEAWDVVTLTLVDSKGNVAYEEFEPEVSGDGYAVTIRSFKPNERLHVSRVSLGQLWVFDNDNLVDFTAQLRGANSVLDEGTFTLEGSEIEFEAYVGGEGDSYIELFGNMEKNSEITWTCGYAEDMADVRTFYLTEASYDAFKKTATIKGCDATIAFLDDEYMGKLIESTYANVRSDLYTELKSIITSRGITPIETGTAPIGTGTTATNVFIDKAAARDVLAKATVLYDCDDFQFIYRDAGRPEIIASGNTNLYYIDEENTAEFTTQIEKSVKEYNASLFSSYKSSQQVVASQSDCDGYSDYYVSTSEPVAEVYYAVAGLVALVNPYTIKLRRGLYGTISVQGKNIINAVLEEEDPVHVTSLSNGIAVSLGNLPKISYENGSLTEKAMESLLESTNLKYTFKWRGNPHIKPYDRIQMTRMNEEVITMRISSVSYEFTNGGLISEITARKVGA